MASEERPAKDALENAKQLRASSYSHTESLMTSDKTRVALRVLTAINNGTNPDHRDLLLLFLYHPDQSYLEPDELACMVIQRALDARKAPQRRHSNNAPRYITHTVSADPAGMRHDDSCDRGRPKQSSADHPSQAPRD
jgi:hypothetical protein